MANQRSSGRLPEDVIKEILLKLPARYIVKFNSVCKDWFALTKDPQFTKAHLQRSATAGGIIFQGKNLGALSYFEIEKEEEQIDFNFKQLAENEVILRDSCDGLVLLQRYYSCKLVLQRTYSVLQFYVCNLVTKLHLKLPRFLPGNNFEQCSSLLAFDNSTQQYKVVITLKQISGPSLYKCRIFTLGDCSSGSGSWKELDMPKSYEPLGSTVSINGALYWMALRESHRCILVMDLATEKFMVISCPKSSTSRHSLLVRMRGSLYFTCTATPYELNLWVLNDPKKQAWSREFSINVRSFPGHPTSSLKPLIVMENPRRVILLYWTPNVVELLSYDVCNCEFKVEMKNLCRARAHAHAYSFVSF